MTSRTSNIALIASLVLNVFLFGAIAGGAYRWFADHREPLDRLAETQSHALRDAAQDLSSARQQQFLDALKHARREARPLAQAGREGRREVLGIIAAPQFDRAGLDSALAQTRDADRAARTRVEAAVADFVATLTPTERVTFAQSLKAHGQWREPSPPPAQAAH